MELRLDLLKWIDVGECQYDLVPSRPWESLDSVTKSNLNQYNVDLDTLLSFLRDYPSFAGVIEYIRMYDAPEIETLAKDVSKLLSLTHRVFVRSGADSHEPLCKGTEWLKKANLLLLATNVKGLDLHIQHKKTLDLSEHVRFLAPVFDGIKEQKRQFSHVLIDLMNDPALQGKQYPDKRYHKNLGLFISCLASLPTESLEIRGANQYMTTADPRPFSRFTRVSDVKHLEKFQEMQDLHPGFWYPPYSDPRTPPRDWRDQRGGCLDLSTFSKLFLTIGMENCGGGLVRPGLFRNMLARFNSLTTFECVDACPTAERSPMGYAVFKQALLSHKDSLKHLRLDTRGAGVEDEFRAIGSLKEFGKLKRLDISSLILWNRGRYLDERGDRRYYDGSYQSFTDDSHDDEKERERDVRPANERFITRDLALEEILPASIHSLSFTNWRLSKVLPFLDLLLTQKQELYPDFLHLFDFGGQIMSRVVSSLDATSAGSQLSLIQIRLMLATIDRIGVHFETIDVHEPFWEYRRCRIAGMYTEMYGKEKERERWNVKADENEKESWSWQEKGLDPYMFCLGAPCCAERWLRGNSNERDSWYKAHETGRSVGKRTKWEELE